MFNCCGNITEWGVDLNPDTEGGTFDFIFQVWRPSSSVNITGCYNLVDDFISSSILTTPKDPVVNVVLLPQDQLLFQPGDVLGFYVERHGGESKDNDGVVVLSDGSHNSELIWHASVDITAVQPSQSVSCPYPVGTNGALNSLTHAAPVISVSLVTTPCSNTPLHVATPASFFPKHPTSTNANVLVPTVTTTYSEIHTPVETAVAISFQSLISTSVPSHVLAPSSASQFLSCPTSTSIALTEIYTIPYHSEDPSDSLSTLQVVGTSVLVLTVVVFFTATAVTVLCCIRKKIPLSHAPSDSNTRKQSTIPLEEHYPDVVASMQLNNNQAYGICSHNSTRSIKDTNVSVDGSSPIPIKLKGNEAYAALDL